jgi:ABC-type multidrug transport system fused ATPase/permease subunit
VLNTIGRTLRFLKPKEQLRFFVFLSLRAIVALLDLVGILAIGFLATSMALFLTQGSDPNRTIEVSNLSIPAISAQTLPFIASMILILFISKAIVSILLTRQLAHFLARIEARAARSIARKAFGKGLEGARLYSREEISFAVQAGSPSAFNLNLNSLGTLVAEGFLFLLILVVFALVNPAVAIGAIVFFGFIGFLIQFFIGRLMQKTGVKIAESAIMANAGIYDLSEVLRESATLGKQSYFFNMIYESRLKASGSNATQFVLSGMPRYIVETALIVAIAAFILVQAASGDIASSAATLGIFLSGGLRLTASLLPLQSALLTMKQAIPAAVRALDLLESPSGDDIQEGSVEQVTKLSKPVSVSLKNVDFSYQVGDTPTLSNISLEIPAGSQAAFIGLSGAGKSTLADLILGLLSPSKGEVLIENVSASTLIESQPGLLGYVPQKPGMVTGTIAQNIALGMDVADIDEARLEKAAGDSHLADLLNSLPDGMNTDLGKRKDELSGGQLQRIGLARALYTQPKLLVMDEATSALDAESESEINKALDEMRGKVTVILIAHRLNTIQRSDIVFLVESGQITDSGTFSELLKRNGTVQNLAELMAIESP